MARLIELPTFSDERGSLTVIESFSEFNIKRIYYIYNVYGLRGGHRHKKTKQGLICLSGSCEIYVNDGNVKQTFKIDSANKCLLIEAKDWHTMDNFSENAVLLVLASEYYNKEDYIDDPYNN